MLRPAIGIPISLVASALILTLASTTSAATCPNISRSLSRGASGTDVTALQQFLITQGVLSAGSATGYFGLLTEKAVQTLQKAHNVVSSGSPATTGFGFVGKKTQAAIASLCSGSVSPSAIRAHVVPKLKNPNCPAIKLPIGKACNGKWKEMKDTKGCTASWRCE